MSNDQQHNELTDPSPWPWRNALSAMLVVCVTVPLLQACAAAVVTGIALGASVAHDRRSAGTVVDDQNVELRATQAKMADPDIDNNSRIAVTSYNLIVLLTGQAQTQDVSDRFADKISRLPKVRRVVNEVTIGPTESFQRESEDTLITSRVKFALTEIKTPGFDPTRVKVVTEAGVVYLMGLLSANEVDAVVEKARYVPGVKKVVKVFEYVDASSRADSEDPA